MNVLIITGHDVWGSLDTFSPLKNLLLALATEGRKVILLTYDKVNDAPSLMHGPPVKEFSENVIVKRFHIPGDTHISPVIKKLPIIRSLYAKIKMELTFPILAFFHGIRLARKHKVDVLYGYEIYGCFIAFVLSKIFRTPLILRYQGTLMSHVFAKAKKSLWGKLNVLRYYFHIFALRLPADLIVMTDDGTLGEQTVRKLGNKSPMVFWRNGFDFAKKVKIDIAKEQIREELNLPQNAKILLSASRLTAWKRMERIFNALPFIAQQLPDFLYVCVGDGDKREELEYLAEKHNVREKVIFAGSKIHKEVIKYMYAADVFISMNDWTNIGNPTLEAMICGMPIVVYDTGDTSRVIHDGENGILLSTDEPKAVADSVSKLMTDKDLKAKFSKRVQEFAERNLWTWEERMATEIAELESLLAKK